MVYRSLSFYKHVIPRRALRYVVAFPYVNSFDNFNFFSCSRNMKSTSVRRITEDAHDIIKRYRKNMVHIYGLTDAEQFSKILLL